MISELSKKDKTILLVMGSRECSVCGLELLNDNVHGYCCKNISCNSFKATPEDIAMLSSIKECVINVHGNLISTKDIEHKGNDIILNVNIECDKDIEPIQISSMFLSFNNSLLHARKKVRDIFVSKGDSLTLTWKLKISGI